MAKKASEKKVEEVKEVKATVVEEVKAAKENVAEAVATEKKAEKKPAAKKAVAEKKTAAKKETAKAEKQEVVFVQFAGEEFVVEEVMEKAKAAYVAEGHRAASIKTLRLYIKPEERKAYYVVNDKAAGSIDL